MVDPTKLRPAIVIVEEGESALFLCESTLYVNNDAQSSWTFNGKHIPNNAKPVEDFHIKLLIENVTLENQGNYECKGYNDDGGIFMAVGRLLIRGMLF